MGATKRHPFGLVTAVTFGATIGDMSSHRVSLDTTPGLISTWTDATCSCGWTTMSNVRTVALAQAEEHLDSEDADVEDFDALCSL